MMAGPQRRLIAKAAAPYRKAGRYAWHFAVGKLRWDPVFSTILRLGLIPASANILDLGCGQGLLASWLIAASRAHGSGDWPAGWPAPPRLASYRGIELNARDLARARAALPAHASVEHGDIRGADFARANVIIILDVLHYMDPADQGAVLARARACLEPGGVLLLRVGDAGAGPRSRLAQGVDRVVALLRRGSWGRLHCRPLGSWGAELRDLGFAVLTLPMSTGTPFANHLLVASTAGESAPAPPGHHLSGQDGSAPVRARWIPA